MVTVKFFYILLFMSAIFLLLMTLTQRSVVVYQEIYTTPTLHRGGNTKTNTIHKNEILENIPETYLNNSLSKPTGLNKSCAIYPRLPDLSFNNLYWQSFDSSNGTFHLMNAFFDNRTLIKNPTVRILSLINHTTPPKTYCQFWYTNKRAPILVPAQNYTHIFSKAWGGFKNGIYNPYLISCELPKENLNIPASVSLVEKPCNKATNNLRVIYNEAEIKEDFVICVKGLSFTDENYVDRLTEWIELNFILGAKEIFFYTFQTNEEIDKLLKYYENTNRIHVKPITIAGEAPNIPILQHEYLKQNVVNRRLQEVLPYNDCLYKNIYKYKYVVLVDTDEVIFPKNGTWRDLIDLLVQKYGNKSSYVARNVYFLDTYKHNHEWHKDIPENLHMLQHVYRSRNYTRPGAYVKGFHDTSRVILLHNHFPRVCVGYCKNLGIDIDDAQLQHYRDTCVKEINCNNFKEYVVDTGIWRFKEQLTERVQTVLQGYSGS